MITTTSGAGSAGPALTSADLGNKGSVMGKDEFLKMLVAQLRHQDPLNPMDGQQMAAQMAQFSSVEQLMNINSGLAAQQQNQAALLGAMQTSGAIGTIGRDVQAVGNDVLVGNGGVTSVDVDVAGAGGVATLTIYDATGERVGGRDLGEMNGGSQTISLGSATSGLADGHYTYAVTVKDAKGNDVAVQPYMRGTVDGIRSTANGLVLTSGALNIPYTSVVQIFR